MIAITVEEEGDILKFKDYTSSESSSAVPEIKKPSEPEAPAKQAAPAPAVAEEKNIPKPTQKSPEEDRIFASPLARKLAEEHQVSYGIIQHVKGFYLLNWFNGDILICSRFSWTIKVSLSSIKGTGPDGRIVKADIEDYLGNVHIF